MNLSELNGRQRTTTDDGASADDPLAALVASSDVAFLRQRLKRGEVAFRAGEQFGAIYGIRSGFFKTGNTDAAGRAQVMGFFMRGEFLGLEGIGAGHYEDTATALEDSEVAVLPFALLEDLSRRNRGLQRQLHAVLSREITRRHGAMLLLGSMSAEARLATFLVNLSMRLARRGFSPFEFMLRMTRQEIGSYLGLELETVSREFSRFHSRGLLDVRQKHVRILDTDGLHRLIGLH